MQKPKIKLQIVIFLEFWAGAQLRGGAKMTKLKKPPFFPRLVSFFTRFVSILP